MVELNFIESLKQALDRLEIVNDKMDSLSLEKDELRAKIRKWMDLHGLEDFESLNSNKTKLWQMVIAARKRSNVDKAKLKELVTPKQYEEVVTESEYEVFTVKQIKQSKKASSAPSAPKGKV